MELQVRLSAKDMQSEGVFKALENLCKCFEPEKMRGITIHPPKEESKTSTEVKAEPPTAPTTIPVAPVPVPVPTSAIPTAQSVTYELPTVAKAAGDFAEISEANRKKVWEAIASMGVGALTDMSPEQLGIMATKLREMGARI